MRVWTSRAAARGRRCQRDAHGLGRIDAIGDRYKKAGGADGILCVSTNDTEISHQLSGELGRHAGSGLLDDAHKVVTRDERQWSLEVRVAAAPDEGIGEAGAAASTLMRTSPGPGSGIVGCSASSRTSGPPNRAIRMCCQAMRRI
jgi:hypothetical protein